VLNEYSATNKELYRQYGIERRIYVNGNKVELGAEIEKSELRRLIKTELDKIAN
jgi:hypothetical protein